MRSSEQCGGHGWDIILLSSCTLLALPASRETPDASSHPTIQSFDVLGSSLVIDGNNFGVASIAVVTCAPSATVIVAALPDSVSPGSYSLWVESFGRLLGGAPAIGLWSCLTPLVGTGALLYTRTGRDANGASASSSVTVTVVPPLPAIAALAAPPLTIVAGSSVTGS